MSFKDAYSQETACLLSVSIQFINPELINVFHVAVLIAKRKRGAFFVLLNWKNCRHNWLWRVVRLLLADIVCFDSLRIVVSLMVLKRVY